MAARSEYGVAAHPGCAALASAAALRTSAAVALPTLVIVAPVAGSRTSIEPPAALRHSVPNTRPRHVDSIKNFGAGTFIPGFLFVFVRSETIAMIDVTSTALRAQYPGGYCARIAQPAPANVNWLIVEIARSQRERRAVRGTGARPPPGFAIARERAGIGKPFGGDEAFECGEPMVIISLAGIGIAGGLRLLDFPAESDSPLI